jgi:hypothetical protein
MLLPHGDERFPVVYVTTGQLRETAALLASFANRVSGQELESEGVVYWFGLELGERAVVTTLVVPDADTTDGSVRTSAVANAEAMEVMIGTPLLLLGQAHSHPSRFVGHSRVDDDDTFAQFPGALSLVIPFFGRKGMELEKCGVHRHMEGRFQRIGARDLVQHLRVLPDGADFRRSRSEMADDR